MVINDNLNTLISIKNDIKEAIELKGVPVNDGYNDYGEVITIKYEQYADKIRNIPNNDSITVPAGTKFAYSKDSNTNITYIVDSAKQLFYKSFFTTAPHIIISGINVSADSMFDQCYDVVTIPSFNCENIMSTSGMFEYCSDLTNVGYLTNIGKGFLYGTLETISLSYSSKLTKESCMNIINSLYDLNLNNSYTNAANLEFHATPYALLSPDDIAIATNKGWIVESA